MANISKYVKLHKNLLLEYIYDGGNLISEPYNILVNTKERVMSYMAGDDTITSNNQTNQLFVIDRVTNRWGKVNPDYYSFLQVKKYPTTSPTKHDRIKIHLPVNWTFGEYLGFNIKVYCFNPYNDLPVEFSNFYFDATDVEQQYLLNFTSPPLLFQEKQWGKNIEIQIPSPSEVSSQIENGIPIENTVNFNLTNANGVSLNSPIFIELSFIKDAQTINGVTTYLMDAPIATSVPQTPEYERLGLMIEESPNGDFFEIYGTYNGNIAEFKRFIDDSVILGNRYYVQYNITMFEQNIRGKTTSIILTDNFNEPVEYRPIIKYSTTTAIIDVEMRLIDAVDESYIIRRASYGMLQDEVSKYSMRLMKINLTNAFKPKIYNIKNSISPELVGISNAMGVIQVNENPKQKLPVVQNNTDVQVVRVPFPVLADRFNIMSKSDNAVFNSKTFYGFGKMQILLYPFDNIVKFTVASGSSDVPEFMDLTKFTEIKMVIKNDKDTLTFLPYIDSEENDLINGSIVFKLEQGKYTEIKKIYNSGINVFYITGTNVSTSTVIYTGTFKLYDDKVNVDQLNEENLNSSIILDPEVPKETAIATRRVAARQANLPKKKL